MRKRKYLDDVGVIDRPDTWNPNDKRQKQWKKERKKFGFDERETWCMDFTFYLWLYERLKMFLEIAPIDFEYHTYVYKGNTYTQKQLIDMMIERLEFYFKPEYTGFDNEQYKYVSEIEEIWAVVLRDMWW